MPMGLDFTQLRAINSGVRDKLVFLAKNVHLALSPGLAWSAKRLELLQRGVNSYIFTLHFLAAGFSAWAACQLSPEAR